MPRYSAVHRRTGPGSHRSRVSLGSRAAALSAVFAVACAAPPEFSRFTGDAATEPNRPDDGVLAGTGGVTVPDGSGGSGVGGTIGSGGMPGSGGAGSGGTPGTAGATGTGGAGAAGRAGTGGVGSGGAVGTGGAGTGGTGSGGAVAAGGNPGSGGITGGGTGGNGTPIVISIDFVGGVSASSPAPALTASEIAGVKPVANWNSASGAMGSLDRLVTSRGSATGTSVTWSSPPAGTAPGVWRINYPDVAGDQRMMNGYLDPSAPASPATVTVSALASLVTTPGYDVYVYTMSDPGNGQTRTYTYSITGVAGTFSVRQSGPTDLSAFPGFTAATTSDTPGNYFVFRNLKTASFTLTATPGPSSNNVPRAPINAIQIVSPSGS